MTLIPLISAIVAAPKATTAPAGAAAPLTRNSYGSDARHHPVAALFAVGLPAALVVAVALSPMIVQTPPESERQIWDPITLEKPKPPEPQPDAKPQDQPTKTVIAATDSPLPPLSQDPPVGRTDEPYVPPAGSGTGTVMPQIIDPPVQPPKLVLAQLDQRYAGLFQPDYPARAQREGIEGVAVVRVLIGIDGRVKAVELVSTDDPAFFEATKRRALTKWRFKAATRGGVPEESWKEMRVRFEIKNA
ncbi:energy transducer TonB [Sphingopyxis sp. Root214]|uniref:energy transducer TonB n=1 Tax=unclassified Sphingopyxis TaxID=2614943 RepID=UPI0006FD97ED|nr:MULTISPECIES: energy transducer TonB [unclassified Sphingopyxis]KQZ73982.1 energy transducer TonB [Sphingopyxis sp. Root154]KRC08122.1 energy transducer TonB [Sphingopyxis sp. Root214]